MTSDLKDIVLKADKELGRDDRKRLLDVYRYERPDMYADWVFKETHPTDDPANVLKDIQFDGMEFLRSRCTCSDMNDVIGAWGDMRAELLEQLRAAGKFPGLDRSAEDA